MKTMMLTALLIVSSPVSAAEYEIQRGYMQHDLNPPIIRDDGNGRIEVYDNQFQMRPSTTYERQWDGSIDVYTGQGMHGIIPDYVIRER